MKSKGKRFWLWGMGLCIALPVLLAASSNMPSKAENVENTSTEVKVTAAEKSSKTQQAKRMKEALEPYQQIILYLREGLYQHDIEDTYQAYFSESQNQSDGYFCGI